MPQFNADHHLIVNPADGVLLASCQCGEIAPTATVDLAGALAWYEDHWSDVDS